MHLDQSLIAEAQILANGRYVHKVANYIAAYKSAYGFALEAPDAESISLFKEAEQQLIKFIGQRRRDKYSENKDLQKGIENIRVVRKTAKRTTKQRE